MQIRNIEQADKAGLEHLELERKIEAAKAERDKKIANIKAAAKKEIDPLEKKDKTLLEALGDWALTTDERDEGTRGQITLTHTRITIRTTERYKYPSPLQKVIDKAKKLSLGQFVRVKEELNKDRIRAEATPEQLSALGIKVETEQTAYVEAL